MRTVNSLAAPRVDIAPEMVCEVQRDEAGSVVGAAPATHRPLDGVWRAVFVRDGAEPLLVAMVRRMEDGRLLVIPDRINLRGAVTAIRANEAEARAYLEPLALAAKPRARKAAAESAPELFTL